MALRKETRLRFYHAKPPADVLAAFRREVADQLVERALAVQEAGRRGIRVERAKIDREMEKYAARAKSKSGDPGHDNKVLMALLRSELEQEQLVSRLRQQVNAQISSDESAAQEYYRAHPEQFTEPERIRVSVILLRVAPSAPQSSWDGARAEAAQIYRRLKSGADFAELARVHSADKSASAGGDMGYLHKGMLGVAVEQSVAKLSPGEVTEPLTVLEGVALFKLHERQQARLADFAQVRARARELRDKVERERAWKALMDRLRTTTTIRIEEKYLAPG
jgi:parvulin-like peptidyl-prolyl isomerase